jgi:hypothetical protein
LFSESRIKNGLLDSTEFFLYRFLLIINGAASKTEGKTEQKLYKNCTLLNRVFGFRLVPDHTRAIIDSLDALPDFERALGIIGGAKLVPDMITDNETYPQCSMLFVNAGFAMNAGLICTCKPA